MPADDSMTTFRDLLAQKNLGGGIGVMLKLGGVLGRRIKAIGASWTDPGVHVGRLNSTRAAGTWRPAVRWIKDPSMDIGVPVRCCRGVALEPPVAPRRIRIGDLRQSSDDVDHPGHRTRRRRPLGHASTGAATHR